MTKENAITGVIGINNVSSEILNSDMFCKSSVNLSFENRLKDHINFCNDKECIDNEHDYFSENYEEENDTYIINFIKDDKGLYIPDTTKDYSIIVNESTLQIVYSKFFKFCLLCSPCYPNQGDLASVGSYFTYCLPVDYFDDYCNFDTSLILTEDLIEKLQIASENNMI